MWWMLAAQAGMSLLKLGSQQNAADAQAEGIAANTYASETTNKANNITGAAKNSLAAFMQSLGNNRILRSADSQSNAAKQNLGRMLDGAASTDLRRSVASAEQLGALAANSAAAGVGGAAVDTIASTMRRTQVIDQAQRGENVRLSAYDAMAQVAQISSTAVGSLDSSYNVGTMNYAYQQAPLVNNQPNYAGEFLNLASKYGPQISDALGSYFNSTSSASTTNFSFSNITDGLGSGANLKFFNTSAGQNQYGFTMPQI